MKQIWISLLFIPLLIIGCGGDDDVFTGGDEDTTTDVTTDSGESVTISSVQIITDKAQIPSDGSLPATLTALIKDDSNNFISGVDVQFSADNNGGITVDTNPTDGNGQASAKLSAIGDKSNRTITAKAQVGTMSDTVQISVTGTEVIINGPDSIALNTSANYTLSLRDSAGNGISGENLSIASNLGNTLSFTTSTTNFNGEVELEYTAANSGQDNLQVSGLSSTAQQTITISPDDFTLSASATEIPLNTPASITLSWERNGNPVSNQAINFSTTRGTLTSNTINTNGAGTASVNISSNNAGPAVVTASTAGGLTATVEIEFVATVAASIELQADPAVIAPTESANLIAVVRDVNNNLVKNKLIAFSSDDVTGGQFSSGSATTDSQGRAVTSYIASDTSSGSDGIIITATVQDTPSVTDTFSLTVAGKQAFVTFGTGNTIRTPTDTQYQMPYFLQVLDIDGRPIANANVELSVKSRIGNTSTSPSYQKGYWIVVTDPNTGSESWFRVVTADCANEDGNQNAILDAGEDNNANTTLEPGNHASVTPGSIITDENGQAEFTINYAKQYALWLYVDLRAQLTVSGTEHTYSEEIQLEIAASDIDDTDVDPPGNPSPFGHDNFANAGAGTCSNDL